MKKNVGKGGHLLLVLQQLGQVVGDGLCVVVGAVTHHVGLDEIQFGT